VLIMYVDYLLCVIECCLKIERNGRMRALDPSHPRVLRKIEPYLMDALSDQSLIKC